MKKNIERFSPYLYDFVKRKVDLSEFLSNEIGCNLNWYEPRVAAGTICPMPHHSDNNPSFRIKFKEEDSVWIYHCLSGDTRVITWDGVKPIKELAGTTQKILTSRNKWVAAPFYSFGRQNVSEIIMSRNGQKKIIKATPEHRWLIRRDKNREVLTKDLKPHMRLSWAFPENKSWIIKSINENVGKEEVFCAVVEDTHCFALEDNILTGNCLGCGAKGTIIDFFMEYYGISSSAEAVLAICDKFGFKQSDISVTDSLKDVKKKVNLQRKINCAHVVASRQCFALLKKDYAKYNKWVAEAYKTMNKALDAEDLSEIESIGFEASNKMQEK